MYFAPHKLYKKIDTPTVRDEKGNPIPNKADDDWMYICDCFCHDVTTQIMQGYTGKGINPTHYVNLDRRDDLMFKNEVQIRDKKEGQVLAIGSIVDMKRTSGHLNNYLVIFIE